MLLAQNPCCRIQPNINFTTVSDVQNVLKHKSAQTVLFAAIFKP